MKRRWEVWLGGATAVLMVAVGVAINQVLNNGKWSLPWLAAALAVAALTVVVSQRRPESEPAGGLSLAAVADELAMAVGAQWQAEERVRRVNDPYPLPVRWIPASKSLDADWNGRGQALESSGSRPAGGKGTRAKGPGRLASEGGQLAAVLARVPTGRLYVLGDSGAGKTVLMVRLVLDLLDSRATAKPIPVVGSRASGKPVPVLVPVASWDPTATSLRGWLADRLSIDHPRLAQSFPAGTAETTWAKALLDNGLIFPILDGLDEIPEIVRGRAIKRINEAVQPGAGLVVTCRTKEYIDAVRPQHRQEVTLHGAAGIELCPLDVTDIAKYLQTDAGGPVGAARWAPVITDLGTAKPIGQVLRTPLMVSLARAIYNRYPGDSAVSRPELKKLLACSSAEEVKRLLFDAFIRTAYWDPEPEQRKRNQWTADQAQPYLEFLAWHLQHNLKNQTDLAWWELHYAGPRPLVGLAVGLVAGLAGGILGGLGAAGHTGGLVIALGVGEAVTLTTRFAPWARFKPWARFAPWGRFAPWARFASWAQAAHWRTAKHVAGLMAGLVGGFVGGGIGGLFAGLKGGITDGLATGYWVGPVGGSVGGFLGGLTGGVASGLVGDNRGGVMGGVADGIASGVAAGLWAGLESRRRPAASLRRSWRVGTWLGIICGLGGLLVAGLTRGFPEGLAFGFGGGVVIAIVGGLAVGTPADPETEAAPKAVLARDRKTFQTVALSTGIMIGLIVGLVTWAEGGVTRGIEAGLAFAIATGLGAGCIQAAWGTYTVTRYWLAMHRRIPLNLTAFLADAHQRRGVLRQVGAVYQFRHKELQQHLADLSHS